MENASGQSFKGRRGKSRTIIEKFWDFVIVQDGCWGWKGSCTNYGYPQIAPQKSRKARMAGIAREIPQRGHRISWEIHNGPIPEGMSVLHTCDVTVCCNPKHLYLGTQSDNMKDAWTRKRRKPKRIIVDGKVLCKYGHEKVLLPNETEKYVCRECMRTWGKRNPDKYKAQEERRKLKRGN